MRARKNHGAMGIVFAFLVSKTWGIHRSNAKVGRAFTVGVTGDVNLNPRLHNAPVDFVWGDLIELTRRVDVMAIQHESTFAGIADPDPATIQFEDPLNYTGTYHAAGIDFIELANNHQVDYGYAGLQKTIAAVSRTGIAFGGVGDSAASVRKPVVLPAKTNANSVPIAFFSIVIDECWRWPNGSLYLDGCTCGPSANPAKDPPYQCNAATGSKPGLWYHFGITDNLIADVSNVIQAYKTANPNEFVVVYLHVGPNFQWKPYPEHEHLLRNVSQAGADLVWGTSSHHIQRFEVWDGKPIIYGLGDFLFRHVVGVEDWCPLYARPCQSYRPELSLMYIFEIVIGSDSRPSVLLSNITAVPTKHNDNTTSIATDANDLFWIENTFAKVSRGATLARAGSQFRVEISPVK